jgi:hypothetical protein
MKGMISGVLIFAVLLATLTVVQILWLHVALLWVD